MRNFSMFLLPVVATCAVVPLRPTARVEEKEEVSQPLLSLFGRKSQITKPHYRRIESPEAWKALWLEIHTGSPKPKKVPDEMPHLDVDCTRCMVLAVFQGKGNQCNGYRVHSVRESAEQITLRVQRLSYQTIDLPAVPGSKPTDDDWRADHSTEAWGVFVLPRSKKRVVIEENVQLTIDPSPVWKKFAEFGPGDGAVDK